MQAIVMALVHCTSSRRGFSILYDVLFQQHQYIKSYRPDKVGKKYQQRAITQKILMLELWTLSTGLPRLMIFPYMKFHFNSISTSEVIVRTKSEKNYQQRAITQKILMLELWTLCTALPRLMIFPYMKFHFNSSSTSGVIVRTNGNKKYQQRAITQKYLCQSNGPSALYSLFSRSFHI